MEGGQDNLQQRKGKFLGKRPKAKFSKVLKTASDTKTSKTRQRYNEMIAAGNVDMRQATASVNRGHSSAQARKPTKSELLHSLQLANSYADRIEGEKESEQNKGTKATKRAAEWKATAEVARMEKRHAINKLKKAEDSLSAVEMELKIERERTSDAIVEAVSKVNVENVTWRLVNPGPRGSSAP
jgi:hypothetical protein